MRIKGVAQQLGVSTDFLKRLERDGLIPPLPRDCNGHRRITADAVEALRAVIFREPKPSADAKR